MTPRVQGLKTKPAPNAEVFFIESPVEAEKSMDTDTRSLMSLPERAPRLCIWMGGEGMNKGQKNA